MVLAKPDGVVRGPQLIVAQGAISTRTSPGGGRSVDVGGDPDVGYFAGVVSGTDGEPVAAGEAASVPRTLRDESAGSAAELDSRRRSANHPDALAGYAPARSRR